jgi:hypothetical protein
MFSCVFDLSFGIEKLLAWNNWAINPGYWALWYLGLGAVTSIVAYVNLRYDYNCDCNKEKL